MQSHAHPAEHAHTPHLAHHFDTPTQQFESSKLGMWTFLVTEVLLFSGLFCAYAVYRGNHPEVFAYAHKLLDWRLGAINTVALIFSSLTMAWAVRCAQLSQQKWLVINLVITLACGGVFMGIKAIEYKSKIDHGYLPGRLFHPHPDAHGEHGTVAAPPGEAEGGHPAVIPAGDPYSHHALEEIASRSNLGLEPSKVALAPEGPGGMVPAPAVAHGGHEEGAIPDKAQIFFSIYFMMTGLHGIHVLAGMLIIAWILIRSLRREFDSRYFTPVDLVGLYWHLVDLIWIYLFPLLYLIH